MLERDVRGKGEDEMTNRSSSQSQRRIKTLSYVPHISRSMWCSSPRSVISTDTAQSIQCTGRSLNSDNIGLVIERYIRGIPAS